MKKYVLGFLFSNDLKRVVLIRKDGPDWQVGKLNGLGGSVEDYDESWLSAMSREFREEAGIDISDWNLYHIMNCKDCINYVFSSINSKIDFVFTNETEVVKVYNVKDVLTQSDLIDSIKWLIPMALDENHKFSSSTQI